jgi:hypothetical protein
VGDYNPVPIKTKVPDGLFSSKKVITGYKYYVGVDLAWCLGGRDGHTVKLKRMWSGKHLIYTGNLAVDSTFNINAPNLMGGEKQRGGLVGTVAFYNGGFNPAQDPYLLSKCHPEVPAYNGVCRTVFRAFYFGTSPNIEAIEAELSRMSNGLSTPYSIMPNGLDLNPMEIMYDAVTEKWGRFGASPEDVDVPNWQAAAQTLYNEGLGMSLFVQAGITGKQLAEEVLRMADGLLYQDPSTAKICIALTRFDYDPNTLDILDESIVEELTEFSKTTWEATLNQCRVNFKDRAQDYNESVALAQDFALINYQQRVKGTDLNMPGCYDKTVANNIAARQLSFVNVPLFKLEMVCNRKAATLRPGMVRRFNWGPYGLSNLVVRVLKVDLGTLDDGRVRLTCIQDRFATSTPVFAVPDNSAWTPPNSNPAPVAVRRMWEPPYFIARNANSMGVVPSGQSAIFVLANKPGSASVGFDAQLSTDNFLSYTNALEDAVYNGSGLLQSAYSATAMNSDQFDAAGFTLTNVSGGDGYVSYTTVDEIRDGRNLILIDDELMAFRTIADSSGDKVITNVYRGLLGTAVAAHAAGARAWFIQDSDGLLETLLPIPGGQRLRLIDFTPAGVLEPGSAPVDVLALTDVPGKPLPPRYLTLNGSRTPAPTVGATSISAAWRSSDKTVNRLTVYNDPSETEILVGYVLRWRVGLGSYNIINVPTATLSQSIPVTGLTGTLEVRVRADRGGVLSTNEDVLTMVLG